MNPSSLIELLNTLSQEESSPLYLLYHEEKLLYVSRPLLKFLSCAESTNIDIQFRNSTVQLSTPNRKRFQFTKHKHKLEYIDLYILAPIDSSEQSDSFHGIKSHHPRMQDVFRIVRHVGANDVNVLIRGETGTGKELVARAIHQESERRNQPFVAVNCSAISPHLLESVLFGHKKGAFTGALRDHIGLFEQAHRGTLFLDEIGDMDIQLQSKLLRVLEERRVTPLGATKSKALDVRILSATHRSLRKHVADGFFRADLMYRLRVVPIFLPPLRERGDDMLMLFEHFVHTSNQKSKKTIFGAEKEVLQALTQHSWDGNIRELKNVVEYAFAVCEGNTITFKDLPPEFHELVTQKSNPILQAHQEKERIIQALRKHSGHIGNAASELGMSRPTLWRKRNKYNI